MIPKLFIGQNQNQLIAMALKEWGENLTELNLMAVENHPDFHLIPDKENTTIHIEQIRNLVKRLQLKPIKAQKKLVIIQHAHSMTIESQNALLKTLEEPPENVQIILTSNQPYSLLPTILSRVIKIDSSTIKSKNNQSITPETQQLITEILSSEPAKRLTQTAEIASSRESTREFILNLLHYFHQQLTQKTNTNSQFFTALKHSQKSLKYLDANTHPQLTIDNLMLKLPRILSV